MGGIMKAYVLMAVFVISAMASPLDDWVSFKHTHGKRYKNPSEEHYRMNVFFHNKQMIEAHNKNYEKGLESFHMNMNHFGDLTAKEFKALMNKYNNSTNEILGAIFNAPENVDIPDSIDWRTKGAVTPVKNQGMCGSCWAFSTTGSLEGQHFIKTGKLVALSEQNLIDCDTSYNEGCNGGLMSYAFKYIKKNGGLDTEESYPYEAEQGDCRFKKSSIGATDTGFVNIKKGDEEDLKKAVATVGPISIAIDAGEGSFQFYKGGVYFEKQCSSSNLDHGVLAVGYGTENGKDYWLVKNSWGPKWGEEGYIKIARNKNNHCGIATMASYPLV